MANIASGYVSVKSTDKEFLEDLKHKINDGPFSYGGAADIMDGDHGLDVGFTGRWSCEAAWDFFRDLIADDNYAFHKALIDSEISGYGYEEGTKEASEVSKKSGAEKLDWKNVSEEWEWEEEEEEVAVITDKTETLAAVKNEGAALEHASDELKTDPEILALIDD